MPTATAPIDECEVPQDLVDRAMQLSPASRTKFGQLLLDSVAETAAARDLIHSRIAQLVSGNAELLDADEVVDELERRYAAGSNP